MTNAPIPTDPVESTRDVAQAVYGLVLERRQAALAARLQKSAAVMTGRATIVAIGPRSVGKSSLLNALLDRPGLLPVDVDVSSNVYVRVGFAPVPPGATDPGERVLVEFIDGREPVKMPLEQIADWASEGGNPGNERGVSVVRVRLESPLTKAGIWLTDTPGAGGLVAAHGAVVRSACQHADGLLVVLDHMLPISETVLEFLTSFGEFRPLVVFAFNRTDVSGDTERSIADTRALLSAKGLDDLAAAPMIGTSAFLFREAHALGADGMPDESLLADSGVPTLRATLMSAILEPTRRRQASVLCADLADVLATLAAPDAGMLLRSQDRSAITQEAVSELRRLQRLDPRRELVRLLGTLREDSDAECRMAIMKAMQDIEDDVEANYSDALRNSLPARIEDEIQAVWQGVSKAMQTEIIARAEQVIAGIELKLPESKLPGYRPGKLPPVPPLPSARLRNGLTWLVDLILMPWNLLRRSATKHQQQVGASRASSVKYVNRERNGALVAAPHQLRRDYNAQVEQAVEALVAARATRLEALRAVQEAVENPATPGRVAAAEQRLSVVRALEARVRELASNL
jgi:signal recognition particle receptor subunit beta